MTETGERNVRVHDAGQDLSGTTFFFGIMAATETANEGRMHADRMVQEMKDELSEAERTLLAIKDLTARLIGSHAVQTSE